MKIGIDYGTSYVKILAMSGQKHAQFMEFPAKPLNRTHLKSYIRKVPLRGEKLTDIYITGSKTKFLPEKLDSIPLHKINEWDALYTGARLIHPKKDFILINWGSGTSIHLVSDSVSKHIGGTALGGKAIDTFKHYLKVNQTPTVQTFSKLHSTVSELVPDLQGITGSMPGVYFTHLTGKTKKQDIIVALEQMITDEILNITSILCRATMQKNIVCTGGTLMNKNVYARFNHWMKTGTFELLSHDWDTYITCIGMVGVPLSIHNL